MVLVGRAAVATFEVVNLTHPIPFNFVVFAAALLYVPPVHLFGPPVPPLSVTPLTLIYFFNLGRPKNRASHTLRAIVGNDKDCEKKNFYAFN